MVIKLSEKKTYYENTNTLTDISYLWWNQELAAQISLELSIKLGCAVLSVQGDTPTCYAVM